MIYNENYFRLMELAKLELSEEGFEYLNDNIFYVSHDDYQLFIGVSSQNTLVIVREYFLMTLQQLLKKTQVKSMKIHLTVRERKKVYDISRLILNSKCLISSSNSFENIVISDKDRTYTDYLNLLVLIVDKIKSPIMLIAEHTNELRDFDTDLYKELYQNDIKASKISMEHLHNVLLNISEKEELAEMIDFLCSYDVILLDYLEAVDTYKENISIFNIFIDNCKRNNVLLILVTTYNKFKHCKYTHLKRYILSSLVLTINEPNNDFARDYATQQLASHCNISNEERVDKILDESKTFASLQIAINKLKF